MRARKTYVIRARVTAQIKLALVRLAARRGVTESDLIREALAAYIKKLKRVLRKRLDLALPFVWPILHHHLDHVGHCVRYAAHVA